MLGIAELLIIVGAVVAAILVAGVMLLVLRRSGTVAGDALSILERRYARGEISREEFERMREDLRRSG